MSVKFAILGLLLKRPSYPYELSVTFRERIGYAWELNRGQVYQTVYRLEEEGLVERVESKPNAHGIKWIYRVTELGKEEYERWRSDGTDRNRPLRDDLLLKISMATPEDADHLIWMIDKRERLCAERLQEYTEFEADRVPLEEATSWEDIGPTLSTSAALARLSSEMVWLAQARKTLMRLSNGVGTKKEKSRPTQRQNLAV